MIEPNSVVLAAGEHANFYSDASEWKISPEIGSFQNGRYSAPSRILNSRKIFLTAYDANDRSRGGTAEILLTSSPFWLTTLAAYWPALFLVIIVWIWAAWPGVPQEPVLMVNPPAVTIGPGQHQQFYASLNDVPDVDVSWSATSGVITPNGFYTPPISAAGQKDQAVTITATRNSDKTKSAASIVIVSPNAGLFLYPALSHARHGDRIPLVADGGNVDVDWPPGAPHGTYTAPATIDQKRTIDISVTDRRHEGHVASARIVLLPDRAGSAPSGTSAPDTTLIGMALAAGALGAWLASVKSFVAFTGSRSFVPSWALFYLFRPGFGAGLALVTHMAHRSGAIGTAASATNPAVVIFYSALVGLFSEEALQKLHDVFCAVFGIQDKRTDKLGEKTGASGPAPVVTVGTASAADHELTIDGGNFVSLPTVFVNNIAKPVSFISDKKLKVKLEGIAPGTPIEFKVRNPDGKESPIQTATWT